MMDVEQVRSYLPHRYPMLLVDRILEIVPEKRAVGLKNVTINEDFFNGHFPGQAMMPGVLIIEAMAQVGGVLILSMDEYKDKLPVLGGMEKVRWSRPVVPGDTLITEVDVIYFRGNFGKVKLTGKVDDKVVASAELTFAMVARRREEPSAGATGSAEA